jgi:hypothetical protein
MTSTSVPVKAAAVAPEVAELRVGQIAAPPIV